jgi:hypothetical protein
MAQTGIMSEELDIDDPHTPEHAPKPEPEVGIVIATGPFPPSVPLVDHKWTLALRSVIALAKALVIKDATSLQLAVIYQGRLTQARKQLEVARKEVKAPFLAACDAIDAAARVPEAQAAAAVEALRKMQVDFANAEKERVAKEEKARQAELARLQRLADAEKARQKAEADKLAEEARLNEEEAQRERDALIAAGKPPPPAPEVLDIEEEPLPVPPPVKSEAQVALEKAQHAPAPKVTVAVGVQMRTTLIIASVDVDKLPEPFVTRTANMQALRAAFCQGWSAEKPIPKVDGVTFEKKETPVTPGSRI